MKTKLTVSFVLSIVCLLLAVTGVSQAEQPNLDYIVYLPIVPNACTPQVPTYVSVSKPVVEVGEVFTITAAVFNDGCAFVGQPYFLIQTNPAGVLSGTFPGITWPGAVPVGGYAAISFPVQATSAGPVTMTLGANYEERDPAWHWVWSRSSSIAIRILSP